MDMLVLLLASYHWCLVFLKVPLFALQLQNNSAPIRTLKSLAKHIRRHLHFRDQSTLFDPQSAQITTIPAELPASQAAMVLMRASESSYLIASHWQSRSNKRSCQEATNLRSSSWVLSTSSSIELTISKSATSRTSPSPALAKATASGPTMRDLPP